MTRDDRPAISGPTSPLERVVVWLVIAAVAAFDVWALWQAMHA